MKCRKKPIVVEAHQWFKNGDHPDDGTETFKGGEFSGKLYEGKIVRYFNDPTIDQTSWCGVCKQSAKEHGWIDTLEGGHRVCPGDYIITGPFGEYWPVKPDIFEATYEVLD